MPLASSGARALKPAGGGLLHGGVHNHSSRSIHIPSFVPRANAGQTTSTAQTLFKQTRHLFSRFVANLAAPSVLRAPRNVPSTARSIFQGPVQGRTIQQGLSYPARIALGRPLQAPCLPRPVAVPRGVGQVGLGLARNFSTARPIFQNLVENVPIAGRAFLEADWDVKMAKEKENMRLQKARMTTASKKGKGQMQKPVEKKFVVPTLEEHNAELDHYFPAAAIPEVTTYLLIPLSPEQGSRLPLAVAPPISASTHPLLPFEIVASVLTAHNTQSLRVNSLFTRLDASRVFEHPGVHCEAYGGPGGLCTLLEIRFQGWDEARVRSVIGEAGQGWCVLEEVWKDQEQAERERMDEIVETMGSEGNASWSSSSDNLRCPQAVHVDPSASLVLPTLDFSASFPMSSPTPSMNIGMPTALSDLEFHNAWSALESDSDHSMADDMSIVSNDDIRSSAAISESSWAETDFVSGSRRGSEGSFGFGFSSEFASRMEDSVGPRAEMF
ncbi:uncharacterized protein LAESUDRAFT_720814 [Laetiporus sulphureus 93-53]|uniref:Uncharacterized protein n=1 Tax=Laetiporus sulphureus 93-53 TaxID=1314785 RepID=A0A165HD16_9APHY|nr:uncharacterized protein LAESUDRAFT_720814 [Laetiporus sulphureus 93-53]KZT11571.1 hypothetical protein LAESUDRAFT_720814 [Laetiporus sulphureus 93-53]